MSFNRSPCRRRASRVVSRQKAKPTCMHAQLHSGFDQVVRFRKIVMSFKSQPLVIVALRASFLDRKPNRHTCMRNSTQISARLFALEKS